jgi:DNA-binding LacI/PurR family transcriptional regulator
MHALVWLKAQGIAVPDRVSVIGFDGVPEGAATDPPLTTIRQPATEMGRRAVQVLIARDERATRDLLDVELVERASTAPPQASRPVTPP